MLKEYDIPRTDAPFVNTKIISAGHSETNGNERFWLAAYNDNEGAVAVLFDESCNCEVYRFDEENNGVMAAGLYNAIYVGDDTLWLCGELGFVIKLNIKTKERQVYYTGFDKYGLVFNGMAYEPQTKKMFFMALVEGKPVGVSFDTVKCETAKIYYDFTPSKFLCASVPVGDGKVAVVLRDGVMTANLWDAVNETFTQELSWDTANGRVDTTIGKMYVFSKGWLDIKSFTFEEGFAPLENSIIFAQKDNTLYGRTYDDETLFYSLDLSNGQITQLFKAMYISGAYMTENCEIIAMTLHGKLYKYSLDGEVLASKSSETKAVCKAHSLMVIDNIIIGTPFISQNFWYINKDTGESVDAGRACYGCGQVCTMCKANEKVYMGSYSAGWVLEYDPSKPSDFPNNPKPIVQSVPLGMRPVCMLSACNKVYCIFDYKYGYTGSSAIIYDTIKKESILIDKVYDGQQFRGLEYNKKHNVLLLGSSYLTDGNIAPCTTDESLLFLASPDDMKIHTEFKAPDGTCYVKIVGKLSENKYLLCFENEPWAFDNGDHNGTMYEFDLDDLSNTDFSKSFVPKYEGFESMPIFAHNTYVYAGKYGKFVIKIGESVDLWSYSENVFKKEKHIGDFEDVYLIEQIDGVIYILTKYKLYEYTI